MSIGKREEGEDKKLFDYLIYGTLLFFFLTFVIMRIEATTKKRNSIDWGGMQK